MAFETLKKTSHINGFEVEHGKVSPTAAKPIVIDDLENSISFKVQNGPIKEFGRNGCQIDDVITSAKLVIEGLNEQFPCRENSMAITKLDEALLWLAKRRMDREKRGVEGFNKV